VFVGSHDGREAEERAGQQQRMKKNMDETRKNLQMDLDEAEQIAIHLPSLKSEN